MTNMHVPLNTEMPTYAHQMNGTKYYIKGEPTCFWPCIIQPCSYRTTVSREWNSPPEITIEKNCSDFMYSLLSPCHCASRQTVTGAATGKVYTQLFSGGETFQGDGMLGTASARPGAPTLACCCASEYTIMPAYVSCCQFWYFGTAGGTMDHFSANFQTGDNMLGIYSMPHTLGKKGCRYCIPSFGVKSCCCFTFPAFCPSQATTSIVRGPAPNHPGTELPPVVGSMTTGVERRCCLWKSLWKPVQGGVINVPPMSDANDLMAWALLWRSTTGPFGVNYLPISSHSNWKDTHTINKVEEMQ
eukprot:TRINITY_DN149_c1_g3_i1.p1 TRINITY_DN149_c1_g3~~TRINITY_DN149_c1_g3_i1.p1  ORF type:complete len:301 (+),score=61.88 TRINITY_DN149_c1_g3_i1:80-982(+)